jgi:septal ring factor EnvC (AmiA/AmiB activator)
LRKNKYVDKIQGLNMLYLAKKEYEEKRAEHEKKLVQLKEENEKINKELNEIRNELIELKLKENDCEQKLMSHYEGLLYQGKDIRNDGLIWIIKSMWKLGKNVPMQYIPKFLDFQAIEFLFKLANK